MNKLTKSSLLLATLALGACATTKEAPLPNNGNNSADLIRVDLGNGNGSGNGGLIHVDLGGGRWCRYNDWGCRRG